MNKAFSKKLYEKYDALAKEEAACFLRQLGYQRQKNPAIDLFCQGDIVVRKNNIVSLVETEIKWVWVKKEGWETKWSEIHVPFRKKKSDASIYILFNRDCSCLGMAHMETIKNGRIITKDTCYMKNEDFLSVPFTEFKFYMKADGEWIEKPQ